MKKLFILFLLSMPAMLFSQQNEVANLWQPFEYFVGSWEGHETGKAGIGKGDRTYEFIMNRCYLYSQNISKFAPQEKNPNGETHEDWGFLSFDKIRKTFVLREFHIEGFVNQYTLDSLSADKKKFIFITESSENAPPGLRARLTLEIKNENEFIETFELAFPNSDFFEYLKNYWRRKIE